jgi:hypothetical protein
MFDGRQRPPNLWIDGMERTTSAERRVAEALVRALEGMLAALATASDGDNAWLRPLAVLSAEIEYSSLRGPTVDAASLADQCMELTALLGGSAQAASEFATRYTKARRVSPEIETLHDRAITACDCLRDLPPRHGPGLLIGLAAPDDVDEIVGLLRANEAPVGSLTGHFTRPWVEAAVRAMPVVVARLEGQLVGVLVSSPLEEAHGHPVLEGMLAAHHAESGAYIYGPICVAEEARGRGVAGRLFERLKAELPGREGILFIRKDNVASLRAHQRLAGMRVRAEFRVGDESFVAFSYAGENL